MGITAINNIKNGTERNTFTTKPNNLFNHTIGIFIPKNGIIKYPSLSVETSAKPIGSPITYDINVEINVIYNVSYIPTPSTCNIPSLNILCHFLLSYMLFLN